MSFIVLMYQIGTNSGSERNRRGMGRRRGWDGID